VADAGQGAVPACEVTGADVVEHQRTVREMPLGQRPLDLGLPLEQPVHGRVEVVGLELIEAQHLSESRGGGLLIQRSRRGQLGAGGEHPGGDQRHTAVAFEAGPGGEDALQAELFQRPQHGGDMTVGAGAKDLEGGGGGDQGLAAQRPTDELDDVLGQVREIAEGFVSDLAALAEGAPQQVGRLDASFVVACCGDDVNGRSTARHT